MPNLNWSLVTLSFLIESSLRRACLSTAWLNAAVRMAFEADAIRNDIAVPHPQAALNFSAAATAHRHPALAGNRLSHMQSAVDADRPFVIPLRCAALWGAADIQMHVTVCLDV